MVAYIREGNTSRRITDNEFRTYVATSKEFQFDLSEAVNATRVDLSDSKILRLLDKKEMEVKRGTDSRIDDNLLQNLGIASKFNDEFKPTIAGYLIFAQNPPQGRSPYERYLVRCVRYAGNSVANEIIDILLIKGRLTVHNCQKILGRVPRATINKDLRDLKEVGIIKSHGASVNIFYTAAF